MFGFSVVVVFSSVVMSSATVVPSSVVVAADEVICFVKYETLTTLGSLLTLPLLIQNYNSFIDTCVFFDEADLIWFLDISRCCLTSSPDSFLLSSDSRVSQNLPKIKKLLYFFTKWFIPLYGVRLDTNKNLSPFWPVLMVHQANSIYKGKIFKIQRKFWCFGFSFFGHVNEFLGYFKARGCIAEVMPVP